MTTYPRRPFLDDDDLTLRGVVRSYPLAVLVSVDGDRPVATQIPLLLEGDGPLRSGRLYGHMDRANPQWRRMDGARCLALFHGPHAYVSPRLVGLTQLPTWNYVTVECHGRAQVAAGKGEGVDLALRLSAAVDPELGLTGSDARVAALAPGIVGIVLEVDQVVGRVKLAQDRAPEDRRNAVEAMLPGLSTEDRTFIRRIAFPERDAAT